MAGNDTHPDPAPDTAGGLAAAVAALDREVQAMESSDWAEYRAIGLILRPHVTRLLAAHAARPPADEGATLTEAEREALVRQIVRRYYERGIQTNETGLIATAHAAIDVLRARLGGES